MSVFDWKGPSKIGRELQKQADNVNTKPAGWKADGGRFYGISAKADALVRKKENPQPVKTAGKSSQQREQETKG